MPDAGDPILVEDFTDSDNQTQPPDISDVSDTSFVAGPTACSATFVAPTSGNVLICVYVQGNADSSTNRLDFSYEIREDDSSGTVVVTASTARAARLVLASSVSGFDSSGTYIGYASLTAGQTYYAQTMHQVSGGSDIDITHREITVIPLPA